MRKQPGKEHWTRRDEPTDADPGELLDASPAPIALIREGILLRCNSAFERLLGYAAGELAGTPAERLEADGAAIWHAARAPTGRNETFQRDAVWLRKDGTRVPVALAARALYSRRSEVVLSVVDLSAQCRLERALAEAEEARQMVETACRAKDRFVAVMSHEIRTPLNAMIGMLELLSLSPLSSDQKEAVGAVRESAHTLAQLIGDILDYGTLESGQMKIKAVAASVIEIARQARALHVELAARKGLMMDLRADPRIAAEHVVDGMRLLQVLSNLVGNAVKFTESGSVTLSAESLERGAGSERIRFSIVDTGVGIAHEHLDRLFEPFVQLDAGSLHRLAGTGLGLSICKRIVAALGGSISLQSVPGQGTTVHVELELPVAASDTVREPERAPTPGDVQANSARQSPIGERDTQILIVEDHPLTLRLLQRQVAMLGYAAETASDGQEALQRWQAGRYRLIITDWQMPGMDGLQLAREIRAIEATRPDAAPIPIIACTASAFADDAEKCLAAGMSDYIAKPIQLDTLRQKLHTWLAREPARAPRPAPVDAATLKSVSGGDARLEREILLQLRGAYGKEVERLGAALRSGDLAVAAQIAHQIKGSSGMVGARALADAAERIERAAKSGAIEQLDSEFAAFEKANTELHEYLDRLTDEDGSAAMGAKGAADF